MAEAWTLNQKHIYGDDGNRTYTVEWGGDDAPELLFHPGDGKPPINMPLYGLQDELAKAILASKEEP